MNLEEALTDTMLTGTRASSEECARLAVALGKLAPEWLLKLCSTRNLMGSEFLLGPEDDLSGFGADLRWMTVDQVIDEAENAYPGIAAVKMGYFPFGICLEGSGDPYFLKTSTDPAMTPVVRIPHESVRGDEIDESLVELVSRNIIDFFEAAGKSAS